METILSERFGQQWSLVCNGEAITMKLVGQPGRVLFDRLEPVFMQPGSPHGLGCEFWKIDYPWQSALREPRLPAPSSTTLQQPLIELSDGMATCHYDILGLAFWAMNRLEEVGAEALDRHQRFSARESHAAQYGYLNRPIVDEWLLILGQIIKTLWPQIEFQRRTFELVLSHDVDNPSRYGFRGPKALVRAIGGDIINRRDFRSAMLAPWIRLNTRHKLHPLDPLNTFDWIMDQSDKAGVKSTFNFICHTQFGPHEPNYEIDHPAIRSLIRSIHQRGHLIGLHPSYGSYLKPQNIAFEFEKLKKVAHEEGVDQEVWGGRMHYLQWSHPHTLAAWGGAGLDYDSTLSFVDRAGFRCGTCFEYAPYNVIQEEVHNIRERPLIAMEASILAPKYMDVANNTEAQKLFLELKYRCEKVGGQFCLLWHNSELYSEELKALYESLL